MSGRWDGYLKWGQFGALGLSLVLLVLALPLDDLMVVLRTWIEGLGIWAPVAFAIVYGVAATLFIPGSALSLGAGAMFGVWLGSLAVWTGAILAMVLSFLVARYAARSKIEAVAASNPRFAAIDRAIGEQGWRIVALTRLSPVFPFTLQNYLYGVTAIGFWPCTLASAVCIVPGMFMYVYAGYAGGEAAMAAGAVEGTDTLRLGLQLVGLLATVAVSVVIARIAAKAIAKHAPDPIHAEASTVVAASTGGARATTSRLVKLAIAASFLLASLAIYSERESVRELFRPPEVVLAERYAGDPGTGKFDHSLLDVIVARHVNADGLVDYSSLAGDAARLGEYIQSLGTADFRGLSRDQKLAFLINAYNAFTISLILEHYPLQSIYDIPAGRRWAQERWTINGEVYSLDQIEHDLIRSSFRDERVHFALVCAAVGCPKLRREAYRGEAIEQQLQRQAEETHADRRWFRYDESEGQVWLTLVYSWYRSDFVQIHGSVLAAAGLYSRALRTALEEGRTMQIRWLPYDWALNDQHTAAAHAHSLDRPEPI